MIGILHILVVWLLAVLTAPRTVVFRVFRLLAGKFDLDHGIEQFDTAVLPSVCNCFVESQSTAAYCQEHDKIAGFGAAMHSPSACRILPAVN